MKTAQEGLFVEASGHFHALEYSVNAGVSLSEIRADVDRISKGVKKPVYCIIGFGANLWKQLLPDAQPDGLKSYSLVSGPGGESPSTQGDIFIWCHSESHDALIEAVMAVNEVMKPSATLHLDLPGFRYRDNRDLTGFVDGSANPKGDDRGEVALIGNNENGAGGTFVLSQKWLHKLSEFKQLNVIEQEKVIGRTKTDSIELEGDDMPPTSHVSRTDLKENGQGVKIYRRSFPYANAHEQGLYFLAFSADIERFDKLLSRMFGNYGDGLTDHLLHYSTPVSGAYWFVPCQADLLAAIQR